MEYQVTTQLFVNPTTGVKVSTNFWTTSEAVGTIIFAHATGFHKEIWNPTLLHLKDAAIKYNFITYDVRNHGDSALENLSLLSEKCEWRILSEDMLEFLEQIKVKRPLIGVGHSMGGCTTLLAEELKPNTFDGIIALEPVLRAGLFPKAGKLLVESARKRRSVWETRQSVKEYFESRKFFDSWDAQVLDEYVNHGTYLNPEGKIELKCSPKQESATFAGSLETSEYCFKHLNSIQVPVLFVGGSSSNTVPSDMISVYAKQCNRGISRIIPGQHLIPQEQPENTAQIISKFVTTFFKQSTKSDKIRSNL
ncbi:hypothetical protein K7432_007731 [Basidiobolus ranarum]|uniref:AB hydrolase-1 domain-containing protein n=1 Tax=Basidiobolus ranarum TaxID=34480 RepID=A0ABR2WT34_9FUNG